MLIHNSGDRGQHICGTNPPTGLWHTEVWKSGVGQSTCAETLLFLKIGSMTTIHQGSQDRDVWSMTTMPFSSQNGNVVGKRNTASMLEMGISPGHSSSLEGSILNNSLNWFFMAVTFLGQSRIS